MKVLGLVLLCGLAGSTFAQMAGVPMAQSAHKVKVASTSLLVSAEGKSTRLTSADLKAMPQRTLTVHNPHSNKDEVYAGVGMDDLLAKFGLTLANGGAKKVYHSYVRAQGTDGYFVIYSASELEVGMHTGDAILALTLDEKPLTEDGQFKMIVGGDKRPSRWVTNVEKLTVVTVE